MYIIDDMTTYKDKMTSVRVPKRIVEMVDDLRSGDILGLSQGQMLAKAVIAYSESLKSKGRDVV